jgi:hypothetical protein
MGIKQKADDARKKAYQKVIATKLLDGIDKLFDRASSKRRWIWELLQNAKDVANGKVKVEIVLTKDNVEFRHNGNPFSIENITHLIEQVSSKERTTESSETSKPTGKFGTGFMTTHLLSRQVEVSGILQHEEDDGFSYKRFNVLLDRSATGLDEMIQKVDTAFSIFEKIDDNNLYPNLENHQPNLNCDTSFRYVLDQAGFQVAQTGIQDLQNAIAYALAFIPTIESVTVTDLTQKSKYSYKTITRDQIGKLSMVTIERNSAESSISQQTIACLSNEKQTITIAVEVQTVGEELYSIQETAKEIPILFCEFPLIGSESFPYPVVINSPLFNPTEPRDSIFLNPENEQKTPQNKAIFEEATLLYRDLLAQVTSDWQNVHVLGKLKNDAKLPENIDANWYKEKILNVIVDSLSNSPVVDTVLGERIYLKNALIPSYKSKTEVEQFAELASLLHADRLPQADHILDWHDILKSDFGKKFPSTIKYTLNHLLKNIDSQKTLEQLATRLSKTTLETLVWIDQVILFTANNSEDLLDEYSIIPNQYDQFKKKKELHQDQAIPEALKDVLKILNLDWRAKLAHKELTYKLSNILRLDDAVDDINKMIRNKDHAALRKAVYTLVSCFPTDATFEQNSKLISKQNIVWKLARDLDEAVPNKINLETWTIEVWKEADLWLLETLVDDIEKLGTVKNLAQKLNASLEDAISWLNAFLDLRNQQDLYKLYTKKTIFPNQKGIFKQEEELYIDNSIPDELKDVLDDLGRGCRGKLLDVGIRGFENNRNQFSVKDVSKEIKTRLQEAKDKDNLAEYWSFSIPIYKLISYFPDSQPQDSKRLAIWEFANQFYPIQIPPQKLLPNLQNFSWDVCTEWILNSIAKDINHFETLEKFVKDFNFDDENKAIEWLDNFSSFVAKEDMKILDLYSILPNQSGLLMHKEKLKKDGGIPEELKEILELLTSDYWNDFLLDTSLQKVESLFEKEQTRTIEDIATEIDQAIKDWELNDKTGDSTFTKVITGMIEWSYQQEDKYIKKIFSYFYANKAQLLLKTLGNSEVSSGIFTILNHREKLPVLTDLAENSEISAQDLQDFAENSVQFKEFKELREKISEQEFQTIQVLTKEISLQEIGKLVENKDKLDVLKLLQDFAEAGETSALILALQELGVYEAITNLLSIDISSNEAVDVPERTIDEQHIADIGREGEEFVYQKLIAQYGENNVNWFNKESESNSPYDFVVTDHKGVKFYIDAKATSTEESNADRIPFYVGSSEWSFSENNDYYYLARVFKIRTAKPSLKFLKFVRLL